MREAQTRNLEIPGSRYGAPRNDGFGRSLPVHDPAHVAVELHVAKGAALIKVADRIRRQLGLFGKSVFAKILCPAGRTIAEVIGAVVVPPRSLVVRGAVENLEMDG